MILKCWQDGGPNNEIWNWGDAVSPEIFRLLNGHSATSANYTENQDKQASLLLCGSTLKWATQHSVIWGSGAITNNHAFVHGKPDSIDARLVRGPLTRAELLNFGFQCPAYFGDPAEIFPRYYWPSTDKEFSLGILPHYIDQPLFNSELFQHPKIKIIDITQKASNNKIYHFIDDVLSCEVIASSSLHGIILSEAYRIPCLWMKFSDNLFGGDFKFLDYYFSTGRIDMKPLILAAGDLSISGARAAMHDFPLPNPRNLDFMIESFPSDLVDHD